MWNSRVTVSLSFFAHRFYSQAASLSSRFVRASRFPVVRLVRGVAWLELSEIVRTLVPPSFLRSRNQSALTPPPRQLGLCTCRGGSS